MLVHLDKRTDVEKQCRNSEGWVTKVERVVYLLGAGFSAPLGLPVMSNFRTKSEEMLDEYPDKYAHFQDVFHTIRNMATSQSYYQTDLFNIEEILSILEMSESLEGRSVTESFLRYIADVIEFYTPNLKPAEKHPGGPNVPSNWGGHFFPAEHGWHRYAMFICAILNLRFFLGSINSGLARNYDAITAATNHKPKIHYSIVTLNYDRIPEKVCDFVNRYMKTERRFAFAQEPPARLDYEDIPGRFSASLAKLHGSIDSGVIVPPTWNKGITDNIRPAWKLAHQLLARATQIRIIGYSLPIADAYVKYLLKSAVIQDPHLKRIDVICRDRDGSVEARYREFVKFNFFTFRNANVTEYLEAHAREYTDADRSYDPSEGFIINRLEEAHMKFLQEPHG